MSGPAKQSLLDRACGWLHARCNLTLRTRNRHVKVFHFGYQTEYAGPGRVLQLALWGGAGYVVWGPGRKRVWLAGRTVHLRLRKPARTGSLVARGMARPYPLVGYTRTGGPGRGYSW